MGEQIWKECPLEELMGTPAGERDTAPPQRPEVQEVVDQQAGQWALQMGLKTPTVEQMITTIVQSGLKTSTVKQKTTTAVQSRLKTSKAEQMTTTEVQSRLKTSTAEQMTTTEVQSRLKTSTVEQMTTTEVQSRLKNSTVEQMTTTVVQSGLKTSTAQQKTTTVDLHSTINNIQIFKRKINNEKALLKATRKTGLIRSGHVVLRPDPINRKILHPEVNQ
ncbi:hypothetical protein DPX16_1525 [Anabarilius grahami]|uniref:Uncharacterized protein n=1 Tax=Anabarilius grahami TaxID=495550 RepID=A0A3N0XSL4_ANAGA|nr:hypothetical protein DPX16_1525 [Anabarilius grahami]